MNTCARRTWLLWPLALAGLTACAPWQRTAVEDSWSGRVAVQVHSTPPQAFSAAFELSGHPGTGRLRLFTPLGTTLAELQWESGRARLWRGQEVIEAASIEALVLDVTGAPMPITALFDWLRGKNTSADGWQPDLSTLDQGRLRAHRSSPEPQADLRLVLTP